MLSLLKRVIYLVVACVAHGIRKMKRSGHPSIVLCYHGIPMAQKEAFARHIRHCQGIQTPSRNSAAPVTMTFDDAFANLLDNAVGLLDEHSIPAIIFAVADNLGSVPRWTMPEGHPESGERTMTAEQLRAVSQHPTIRIGSHTLTHPDLTQIPEEQLRFELTESRRKLESIVGYPIVDLALPHGSYNDQVITEAITAGYKRIYTLDPKPYDPSSEDSCVGRFSMSPDAWNLEYVLTCAGAYSWLSPWRKLIRRIRRRNVPTGS